GIDCQDGDPACDVDGVQNGSCTLGVSVCAFQGNLARCTPQDVTSVKLSRRAVAAGVQLPTLPASSATCGPAALVTLPLRRGGKRASKTMVLRMTALATGKPRRDTDGLSLRCVPNRGAAQCPANPSAGPRELRMSVAPEGGDLDNGWTGTCQTGGLAGQSCRTEGVTTVQAAFGNKRFTLSSDCVPAGAPAGTLTLTLPTTTGTSTLAGPKPCGASENDNCGAGTCTARCTGPACASTRADGQCIDTKGGVSQVCCSSDTTRPCFPTANGGQIVRTGQAAPPTPPFPDP